MAQWLPTQWLDKINDAQRKLSGVIDLMDRLDQCGEDCQEMRDLYARLHTKLEAFKQHFFPEGYLS